MSTTEEDLFSRVNRAARAARGDTIPTIGKDEEDEDLPLHERVRRAAVAQRDVARAEPGRDPSLTRRPPPRAAAAQASVPSQEQVVSGQAIQEQRAERNRRNQQVIESLGQALETTTGAVESFLPTTGFQMMFEIARSTSLDEFFEMNNALLSGDMERFQELATTLANRSPTAREAAGTRAAVSSGAASALGETTANAIELPAEILEVIPENVRRETSIDEFNSAIFGFTEGVREESRKFSEQLAQDALDMGLDPDEVMGGRIGGGFIGLSVPLLGAFKVAGRLTGFRSGIQGTFLRDVTAGGIFGTTFTEGSAEERLSEGLHEAGFFGAFSLVLTAPLAIKGFRLRRLATKLNQGEVEEMAQRAREVFDPKTGRMRLSDLNGKEGKTVLQILSEEEMVAGSSRGQRVLIQNHRQPQPGTTTGVPPEQAGRLTGRPPNMTAEELRRFRSSQAGRRARTAEQVEAGEGLTITRITEADDMTVLVEALQQNAGSKGSTVMLRGVRNPEQTTATLKERFPDLNFKWTQAGDETNVLVSPQEIPDEALSRLSSEGRFPGQRLVIAGQDYEYVGRATRGRVKVRRVDSGALRTVPDHMVQDLPYGTVSKKVPKQVRELVDEVVDEYITRVGQVARRRADDMTEEQLVRAVRNGEINLVERQVAYREFPAQSAFTRPEEVGRSPLQVPDEELAQRIAQRGIEDIRLLTPAEPLTFDQFVEMFARQRGLVQDNIRAAQFEGRIGDAPLTRDNQARESLKMLLNQTDESSTYTAVAVPRIRADEPKAFRVSFFDEAGNPVGRSEFDSMEEAVKMLQELNATMVDVSREMSTQSKAVLHNLQDLAATRVKRRLWSQLPKEEREYIEEIRDRLLRLIEDEGPSLERAAAQTGFNVKRLDGGRVELREANSGIALTLQDEAAAFEALSGVERRVGAFENTVMFPETTGPVFPDAGLPLADDIIMQSTPPVGETLKMLTDNPKIINIRDWANRAEELTGLPFGQAFNSLDEGQQAMNQFLEGWAKQWTDVWSGLSRKEAVALDPFFQRVAGEEMSRARMIGIGQQLGLSNKQIKAGLDALQLDRALFSETGLGVERYLPNHFARIRPHVQDAETLPRDLSRLLGEEIPQQAQAFFKKIRTGELSPREADPRLVQLKYIRAVGFERHMSGPWERARAFLGRPGDPFNIRDLPAHQANRLVNTFNDLEGVRNSRDVMKETLAMFRGMPQEGRRSARRLMDRMLHNLGIEASPEIIDEAVGVGMSLMYGAAMGARPRMIVRNLTQNLWFNYTRLDKTFGSPALERAMTREGWRHAMQAGALRPQQRGLPFGEVAFEGHMANFPTSSEGFGMALDGVTRRLFQTGDVGRRFARASLTPFGSSDDVNRAWSFWWQRMHTERWLQRWESGEVSGAKFVEEGLPYFSPTVKQEFARRLDLVGRNEALDYIAKQATDEAHFIYGAAGQVPWMQSPAGKFAGMFGTYALWSKEYMMRALRYGSARQRARWIGRSAAMATALGITSHEVGVNLSNYNSPISFLTYTGGPGVELALNIRDVFRNLTFNPAGSAAALDRILEEGARLSLPGQGLYHDIDQASGEGLTPTQRALVMMLGRPEKDPGNFFMDFMAPPEPDPLEPVRQLAEPVPGSGPSQ